MRQKLFSLIIFCLSTIALHSNEFELFEKNGKVGLKNIATDQIVISPIYEALGWSNQEFKIVNGLIGAQLNEKWALINTAGKKVTQHIYFQINPLDEFNFLVAKRKQFSISLSFGTINRLGKEVLPTEYSNIQTFGTSLLASKRVNGLKRSGIYSYSGKTIIPFQYKNIKPLEDRYLVIENEKGKKSLFTSLGEMLTEFNYDDIDTYNEKYFVCSYFGGKGLINKNGRQEVPPIYKSFKLNSTGIEALSYPQWDVYQNGKFYRSYFFDEVFHLSDSNFIVNAGKDILSVLGDELDVYKVQNTKVIKIDNAGRAIIKDEKSSKFGVLDQTLRVVIPTEYDSIIQHDKFIQAGIKSRNGITWKTFDLKGNRLNLNQYDSIVYFNSQSYLAKRNGKYGILNTYGDEISPFFYDAIGSFKNDLSVVEYQDRKGLIDKRGHWVIPPYADSILIDEDHIYIEQASQFKLAEFNGHIYLRSNTPILPLSKGYAKIEATKYALYGKFGNQLLEHTYDTIQNLNENLYLLKRDGRQFLYNPSNGSDFELDSSIKILSKPKVGLIKISKDEQVGFINTRGQLQIANRYEDATHFAEGLCAIKLLGKWGFIDLKESIQIQPQFDYAAPFHQGLSLVEKGGFWGLIDNKGIEVISTKYDKIKTFSNHFILIENGLLGIADSKGTLIKETQYDAIQPLGDGIFMVSKSEKFGVIDITGKDILPVIYDSVKKQSDSFLGVINTQWETLNIEN